MAAIILFADGSEEARSAAVLGLEGTGFTLMTASNGVEALWMANRCRPDIVIAAVDLPEIDGIALAWHIRAWLPGTVIILMSSDLAGTELWRMRPLYDMLVSKPVSRERLLALTRRPSQDAAPPLVARARVN